MFHFDSFKLSAVLMIIYFFTTLAAMFLFTRIGAPEATGFALGFAASTAVKYIIGALIAWFVAKKRFPLACVVNIALIVGIANQVLSDMFTALMR